MQKVIFLQDSDEIICDIKAACKNTVQTLGINKLQTYKGLEIIHEGTVFDYYHLDEIETVSKELIQERVDASLGHFEEQLNIDEFYHCLSMRENYRKKLDVNYKKKENKQFNSFMSPEIRNYILDEFGLYDRDNNQNGKVFVGSNLEADDRIGIAATYFYRKFKAQGYDVKIIVSSQDKDMYTIPNIYIYDHKKETMTYNSYEYALKFWFKQILMGDKADGVINYPQGFGSVTAMKLVNDNWIFGIHDVYNKIKQEYINKGIESQCLINAQLLRILTIDFFDTKTQEPILFQESHLDMLQEQLNREMSL